MLDLDLVCGAELNRNLSAFTVQARAETIFCHALNTRAISAHNRHENFEKKRRGGIMLATGGNLSKQIVLSGRGGMRRLGELCSAWARA